MSAANSSAKKRRAPPTLEPPRPNQQQQQQQHMNGVSGPVQTGLTLPQVIAVIDKRLLSLESFVNTSKNAVTTQSVSSMDNKLEEKVEEIELNTNTKFEDYESRFQLIVEQIDSLKDMLMGLQSFTMNVNQKLFESSLTTGEKHSNNQVFNENTNTIVFENDDEIETNNLTFEM
jgi:hypothetical protein